MCVSLYFTDLMNDNNLSIYCNDINTTCDVREYQVLTINGWMDGWMDG